MKTYTINQLLGEAYQEALYNIMGTYADIFGDGCFVARNGNQFHELAEKLGVRFDEKGNIVR